MRRRAKIVCTMGPAAATPDKLRELVNAGMDVARLNFSTLTEVTTPAALRVIWLQYTCCPRKQRFRAAWSLTVAMEPLMLMS